MTVLVPTKPHFWESLALDVILGLALGLLWFVVLSLVGDIGLFVRSVSIGIAVAMTLRIVVANIVHITGHSSE